MPSPTEARERMVHAMASMMRKQGYEATGLTEVLEKSAAPRGSMYFYFPRGKEQLATDAIRLSQSSMDRFLDQITGQGSSAVEVTVAFATAMASTLRKSKYTDGCPVATVALEMSAKSPDIRAAIDAAFSSWEGKLAAGFEKDLGPQATAAARFVLAALEGALVRARVQHSVTPLTETSEQLTQYILAVARRKK